MPAGWLRGPRCRPPRPPPTGPGRAVAPDRSVSTPPEGGGRPGRWAASHARGRARWPRARRRWSGSGRRTRPGRWRPATGCRPLLAPCASAMARLTTSRGASSSTKRSPRHRAAAPRGPAGPRRGAAGAWPGGAGPWVELDELDVGHRHPGPQGHGHAVAGGLGRVGGHREQLAGAPVARTTWAARTSTPGRRRSGPARPGTGRPRPAGRGRTTPRGPRRPWPGWRRPVPAPPRPRWRHRRRGRPGPGMATLTGQGQRPPGCRSKTAPMAISSWTRAGPSSTRTRTASVVAQPGPGGQGVGQVEIGRVLVAAEHGGHAALGPSGRRLGELGLGEHARPQPGRTGAAGHRRGGPGRSQADRGRQARPPRSRGPGRPGSRGRLAGPVTTGRADLLAGRTGAGVEIVDQPDRADRRRR